MAKNLCAKTVKVENAYEVWENPIEGWRWHVLKKYQADDSVAHARWFCFVTSPFTPQGEYGDVYVSEVKANARKIETTKL